MGLVEELQRRVDAGLIRRQVSDDGLAIWCYTERCTYSRGWDKYTRMSRGLVTEGDLIVGLPFPKFFNQNQQECPPLPDEPYAISTKLDGSLLIAFWDQERWRLVTKGSFNNIYTAYGVEQLGEKLARMPRHITVMMEVVFPPAMDSMARCVAHEPGLYYLGARDAYTGKDMTHAAREYWDGDKSAAPVVARIEDLLERACEHEGEEGWVVLFESGLRIKIKTAWYLRLFRAVSNLSERRIKELMAEVGHGAWLEEFPEELRDEAEAIYAGIQERFTARRTAILQTLAEVRSPDRKAFALSIATHPDKAYLFLGYDSRWDVFDKKLLLDV